MLSKNFITRTISAFFILLLMLALVFLNDYVLLFGVILLSTIAIYELDLAFKKMNRPFVQAPAYIVNLVFILLSFFYSDLNLLPFGSVYIIILMILMIFNERILLDNIVINVFVFIYITFSYSAIIIIKETTWLFYMFGVSSITDTFAYLVGMLMGRTKLYEKLSPKKTIEGALGGVFGAIVFAIIFKNLTKVHISTSILTIVTFVLSILSQLGDLIASYIKRKAGIKDYGYIFKGHGGVMDRFDSVLLIAPIIALMLSIF